MTQMIVPPPDHAAELAKLDAVLTEARAELLRFATAHGFRHLCGCGRPTCRNDNPATISTVALLRAVSTEWIAGPHAAGQAAMRDRLLAFTTEFRLNECPDGDPECHCVQLELGDARHVLRTVADAWHGRAGNPAPGAGAGVLAGGAGEAVLAASPPDPGEGVLNLTAEILHAMAEDHAHNRRVLDALADFIDPNRAPTLQAIAVAARGREPGAWLQEARAMATETLASWIPDVQDLPEVQHVVRRVEDVFATVLALKLKWTPQDAAYLELAAADACRAILIRGIAHESVTQALFSPFHALVSLADLDAWADTQFLADVAPAA